MREQETGGGSGPEETPVPRDLPDQQAGPGDDPWDVVPGHPVGDEPDDERDEQAPDTDEAGSGPRGAPSTGTVHPEHPEPQEPSA
ncbi:hypothetical protein GT039_39625 [Streptomyces sp. SID2955]|nr:hypothetical protein [Streptomyces sp. SID2955]